MARPEAEALFGAINETRSGIRASKAGFLAMK